MLILSRNVLSFRYEVEQPMAISAIVSAADVSVTSYHIILVQNTLLKEPDVDSMLGSRKNVQQELFFDFISNFLNFDHNFNVFLSLATLECRLVLKRVSQYLSNVITLK